MFVDKAKKHKNSTISVIIEKMPWRIRSAEEDPSSSEATIAPVLVTVTPGISRRKAVEISSYIVIDVPELKLRKIPDSLRSSMEVTLK